LSSCGVIIEVIVEVIMELFLRDLFEDIGVDLFSSFSQMREHFLKRVDVVVLTKVSELSNVLLEIQTGVLRGADIDHGYHQLL
jgi:hypothetical protein